MLGQGFSVFWTGVTSFWIDNIFFRGNQATWKLFYLYIKRHVRCHGYNNTNFDSIGLLVQENEFKIDFQDGGNDGHLGFPI